MEEWVRGQGFIKESDMSDYLREQRFVTAADMRQLGYATGDDVRQTVIQLVQDEQAQFDVIRKGMQELLHSTHASSASLSERVSSASTEFTDKHTATLAELSAQDAQLMEHINTAQHNNSQAFDLLTAKLTTLSDSKQVELQHKLDEMVSTMQGQLQESAWSLYDQAVAEARSHFGSGRQEGGKGASKGGARERPRFFYPRDCKTPDLPSAP